MLANKKAQWDSKTGSLKKAVSQGEVLNSLFVYDDYFEPCVMKSPNTEILSRPSSLSHRPLCMKQMYWERQTTFTERDAEMLFSVTDAEKVCQ